MCGVGSALYPKIILFLQDLLIHTPSLLLKQTISKMIMFVKNKPCFKGIENILSGIYKKTCL